MKRIFSTVSAVIGTLAASSCGVFSSGDNSLAQVDDLVSCIERVHVDSELGRERTAKAAASLQAMAAPDFHGDAVLAHAELERAIDLAERHAKDFRYSVDCMKRAAEPVFHRWGKDIEAMQSPEIKQRSQTRMQETRQRYDAIVAAADPVLVGYDQLNRALRDHALYLGHDFNAGAVAEIAGEVEKVAGLSRDLGVGFGECLQTTRAYVDIAALPMRVEAARPQPPQQ